MRFSAERMTSRTDGSSAYLEEVLQSFQSHFYNTGVSRLLEELSFWTGCQTMLVIGQDTFVYPKTPILEEDMFYPAFWHKEAPVSPLLYISRFTSTQSDLKLLRSELYKNKLPYGFLCLIEQGRNFDYTDCLLLNHASILCTGLDDLHQRSRQIDVSIDIMLKGQLPDNACLSLFPDSGYAFILLDHDSAAGKSEAVDQQGYLSYLLHHYFPQNLCYSIAPDGTIRLFVSCDDPEQLGQRLVSVLGRSRRRYATGISGRYPVTQAVTAFSEASHAARIGGLLDYGDRLCFFHDLGIYRLFNYPENAWPINQMLGDMDDLLNEMDEEKRLTLALTIRTFVKCRFHYQKTADKLFTHVNTIRYRIKLIEDLWDVDLSSDEDRLLFSVLVKLLPLWMKSGAYSGEVPEDDGVD